MNSNDNLLLDLTSILNLSRSAMMNAFNASGENKSSEIVSKSKEKNGDTKTLISESEECLIFQDLGLSSEGFPVMEEIRRQGKLCDVTLKVDDQSFSGHRIVLAATIPYFQAMFTHDMVESKQKEITMHGIDAIALEALINYAYSGRITINTNNVQCLMVGASFLQLNKVRDACADFIKKRFTPQNVLGIRQFADTLGCIGLVESADKYLQQYFIEVTESEEYLTISCNELLDIIKRDELHVLSEEQVFEAVIKWVKKDPEIRQLDLPLLLSKVRMPLLPPHFLADRIATEDLIRKNHDCSYLLRRFLDLDMPFEQENAIYESCRIADFLIPAPKFWDENEDVLRRKRKFNDIDLIDPHDLICKCLSLINAPNVWADNDDGLKINLYRTFLE